MISSKMMKLAFICGIISAIPGVWGQPTPCNNGAVLTGNINTGILNTVGDCNILGATVNGPVETVNGGTVTIDNSVINGDFASTNTAFIDISGGSDFTGDFEASGPTFLTVAAGATFNDFQATGLLDASVDGATMRGDFEVDSIQGPVSLSNTIVNGPITVTTVAGSIVIGGNDIRGGIVVTGATGGLSITSNEINGGITLASITGLITVSGNMVNGGISCVDLLTPPLASVLLAENVFNGNLELQCAP